MYQSLFDTGAACTVRGRCPDSLPAHFLLDRHTFIHFQKLFNGSTVLYSAGEHTRKGITCVQAGANGESEQVTKAPSCWQVCGGV